MHAVSVGILLSLLLYYYIYHFIGICVRVFKKKTVHCVSTTRNAFHKTKGAYMRMQRIKQREQKKKLSRTVHRNGTEKKYLRTQRHKENLQLAAYAAL